MEWKVLHGKLKKYHQELTRLISQFKFVSFVHIMRTGNQFADAVATLDLTIEIPIGTKMRLIIIAQRVQPAFEVITILEITNEKPWFHDIRNFIEKGEYSIETTSKDNWGIKTLSAQFVIY